VRGAGRSSEIAVSATLVGLGLLSLVEAHRLRALRTQLVAGAVVGDDTFPMVVGMALLALGAACLMLPAETARVTLPGGGDRRRMLGSAGALVLYAAVVPWLGYTVSTALAATALFRGIGGYRWPRAALLGVAVTALLYLLFQVWLRQPLPTGLLRW
jgi:putative tricarboxylic transport membrane protein